MNPTPSVPTSEQGTDETSRAPWRRARTATAALALVAVAVTMTAGACSSTPAAAPATSAPDTSVGAVGTKVVIKDFAFAPKSVTIKAGQTVEFTNEDTAPHEPAEGTPGKKGPAFDVPTAGGESGTTSPLQPGAYPYYCALHEHMKGEIIVQ